MMKPSPEEKWCYIDCPVDCEVEGWSAWNITECKCNDTGGMYLTNQYLHYFDKYIKDFSNSQADSFYILGMSRERIIKTSASPTGRQCPTESTQWKPCPPVPCYKWLTGPWSHCQLHVR